MPSVFLLLLASCFVALSDAISFCPGDTYGTLSAGKACPTSKSCSLDTWTADDCNCGFSSEALELVLGRDTLMTGIGAPCTADQYCCSGKCDMQQQLDTNGNVVRDGTCVKGTVGNGEICLGGAYAFEPFYTVDACAKGTCKADTTKLGETQYICTCFPSDATVTRDNGDVVAISNLVPGDAIIAAREDGSLSIDTVSRFSLATHDSFGQFLEVSTDQAAVPAKPLRLTTDHHLPAGETCCSNVIPAKELVIGETIWRSSEAGKLVAATVTGLKYVHAAGHINPLLIHGGFPVVDGVVTSFNRLDKVRRARVVVPFIEAVGAPLAVRRAIASVDCILNSEVCGKVFNYADGTVTATPLTVTSGAIMLAVVAVTMAAAKMRKAKHA